ncbi:hypothetical protein ACFYKX_19060 [Cytobacillus sp. FJAT-54145]|uniref:Uncharacterized protein n=1 Tax=Cytobacillus spartinae TaxID=3299023 RepID=A0ABW6KIM2_9BACI
MSRVTVFYIEFFRVLLFLVLYFGLIGWINDRMIFTISASTIQQLMGISTSYFLLFSLQFIGFSMLAILIYKNRVQHLFKKEKTYSFTRGTTTILLGISSVLIIVPYLVLLLSAN